MKLTPLKINLLMHIYSIASPFDHPDAPPYADAKIEMKHEDLITSSPTSEHPCGYKVTERGVFFVRMILDTPLPIPNTAWKDPRVGVTS
jgi:hypothetical protein